MASSLFDLTGRVAVVIGGTSGIGRTIAVGLADAGADVVATARRQELVDEVAGAIESRGRRTLRIASDVGDRESLERVHATVIESLGRVDIVVCAAGVTKRVPTLEMDEADWQRILETNLTGTLRAYRAFVPSMIAQRSGRLIGIASISSFVGLHEVARLRRQQVGARGVDASVWRSNGRRMASRSTPIAPGVFRTDMNAQAARRATRTGVSGADADAALRPRRGAGRRGGVPGVRRGGLRDRPADRGGWRYAGERGQPVKLSMVISERDNVATALEPLEVGREVRDGPAAVVVRDPIPRGHKMALRAIAEGESVVKYGSPIGVASQRHPGRRSRAHAQCLEHARARRSCAGQRGAARRRAPADRRSRRANRDRRVGRSHERAWFLGLPAARRPGRRAQPRARRAHRDLLVGGG